jgi:hypothetical protein
MRIRFGCGLDSRIYGIYFFSHDCCYLLMIYCRSLINRTCITLVHTRKMTREMTHNTGNITNTTRAVNMYNKMSQWKSHTIRYICFTLCVLTCLNVSNLHTKFNPKPQKKSFISQFSTHWPQFFPVKLEAITWRSLSYNKCEESWVCSSVESFLLSGPSLVTSV